ncbi:hypothetical protein ROA7450_02414 [Roseovarius albus]|uniref:DUF4177 domain-containing protein n=1 Tax=Roseovarius albus TaxID=1247867 RepID=A0A1X6ZDY2_9RHOB|nr:DUF4177 domain-containing protein [Roseovarius albus]SLN49054.1 hypothetical protein ROA7450_02414 [Roseovarius albus]
MPRFEYKIIPAPTKGKKAPGVKTGEARFAHALEEQMNELARDGWEYQRSDILPSEERQGLTSTQKIYRSVLVFRREVAEADAPKAETTKLTADRSEPSVKKPAPPVKEPAYDPESYGETLEPLEEVQSDDSVEPKS